jgi:hypothetical protein
MDCAGLPRPEAPRRVEARSSTGLAGRRTDVAEASVAPSVMDRQNEHRPWRIPPQPPSQMAPARRSVVSSPSRQSGGAVRRTRLERFDRDFVDAARAELHPKMTRLARGMPPIQRRSSTRPRFCSSPRAGPPIPRAALGNGPTAARVFTARTPTLPADGSSMIADCGATRR